MYSSHVFTISISKRSSTFLCMTLPFRSAQTVRIFLAIYYNSDQFTFYGCFLAMTVHSDQHTRFGCFVLWLYHSDEHKRFKCLINLYRSSSTQLFMSLPEIVVLVHIMLPSHKGCPNLGSTYYIFKNPIIQILQYWLSLDMKPYHRTKVVLLVRTQLKLVNKTQFYRLLSKHPFFLNSLNTFKHFPILHR